MARRRSKLGLGPITPERLANAREAAQRLQRRVAEINREERLQRLAKTQNPFEGDPNTSAEVNKYAKRMGTTRPSSAERDSIKYNGNASNRTRKYANKGENRGAGAAVLNRRDELIARYGNDARIQRATQNILAKSTVWQ